MLLSDLTSGTSIGMLEKTLAFTEARNKMLAENLANATTPGYRTKQLDVASFQAALREAADRHEGDGGRLSLKSTGQFRQDSAGRLEVRPGFEPVESLLFHDGTNARIERQMAALAENTMMHQASAEMLRGHFDGIRKAIRGRIQ